MSNEAIPQVDILASYQAHQTAIDAAIRRVLDSGWYVLGTEVENFERRFADYAGADHGIGVASGTDAVEIALRGCGIGPGDLVLTVSHTAVATVAGIERTGAEVVFVDVDRETFTMSPTCLEETIDRLQPTDRDTLKAVVPVHLYGHMADMISINQIARRFDLQVIEDCAQAHGAALDDRPAGSWGNVAAFSFYPTKNLGAIGDGGMITTSDKELAERSRQLRQYGWERRYVSDQPGVNSRLDEIQAAILNVKLNDLDKDNQRRRSIARRYDNALAGGTVEPPLVRKGFRHVYHQYVVRNTDRDGLREHLRELGIACGLHYPLPVHQQPAYRNRRRGCDLLPVTEELASRILSLPMYPQLSDRQVMRVCTALKLWSA